MRFHRTLGVVGAILFCGFVLGGCGDDDGLNLSEVKKFDAYPVYYAGPKVAGLPLEEILGVIGEKNQPDSCCTFIYGSCTPSPGTEGSCMPPLEIQVFSACERGVGALNQKRYLYDFHGAKAAGGKKGGVGSSSIEVFTGRTTVIVGSGDPSVLETAARQLRSVRATQPQSSLPPPARGSLWGKLPCQRRAGG
jgi:hypothetical protein